MLSTYKLLKGAQSNGKPEQKSELRLSKPPEHPKAAGAAGRCAGAAETPEDKAYIDAIVEVVLEREERHPTGLLPDPSRHGRSFSSTIIPRRGRTCPSTRQRTPEQPHQNQPPLRQSTGPQRGQNATFFDALS